VIGIDRLQHIGRLVLNAFGVGHEALTSSRTSETLR